MFGEKRSRAFAFAKLLGPSNAIATEYIQPSLDTVTSSITSIQSSLDSVATVAANITGGSESYTSVANLPLSGNDVGSLAFVQETNRLYIWNGTGWFNIALINTNPTITQGPDASYVLDDFGTPTVITLEANDPEGLNIQWNYEITSGSLTNGGGTTATIQQNNNIFTITPSTNMSYAGSFDVSFTASDGINVSTSTSTFSLINNNPIFTLLPNSIYDLDINGAPIDIILAATDPEGQVLTWNYEITSGSLTNGGGTTATIQQTDNVFTITPGSNVLYDGSFVITFMVNDGKNTASVNSTINVNAPVAPGGVLYETPGTYSWTCPVGVQSVSVVCVGAGGPRSGTYAGAGGGLGWKNRIPVTPGNTYTVVVGRGYASSNGGSSYFIDGTTVVGGGGGSGTTVGTFVGDGGGNGGRGGYMSTSTKTVSGGGGAGGYTGNGGGSYGAPGQDGAGGGGGAAPSFSFTTTATSFNSYGGGGVGVYGQGANGAGGGVFNVGFGGSGGTNGTYNINGNPGGGLYGGGRGRHWNIADDTETAGHGAVRIVWGSGRAFPSTNVDLASSTDGETII